MKALSFRKNPIASIILAITIAIGASVFQTVIWWFVGMVGFSYLGERIFGDISGNFVTGVSEGFVITMLLSSVLNLVTLFVFALVGVKIFQYFSNKLRFPRLMPIVVFIVIFVTMWFSANVVLQGIFAVDEVGFNYQLRLEPELAVEAIEEIPETHKDRRYGKYRYNFTLNFKSMKAKPTERMYIKAFFEPEVELVSRGGTTIQFFDDLIFNPGDNVIKGSLVLRDDVINANSPNDELTIILTQYDCCYSKTFSVPTKILQTYPFVD